MTQNFYNSLLIILFFCHALTANIDEGTFNQVVENIRSLYQTQIEDYTKKSLIIHANWHDIHAGPFHISSARCSHDLAILSILGHVAQHSSTTLGSFVLFACHEVGHFLGGEPKKKEAIFKWSTIEGQADYWAAKECYKEYFKNFPNLAPQALPSPTVQGLCNTNYFTQENRTICYQEMQSIRAIGAYLTDADAVNGRLVNLESKDPRIVQKLKYSLPSNQCRIDTYVAAALNLARPQCWFAQ